MDLVSSSRPPTPKVGCANTGDRAVGEVLPLLDKGRVHGRATEDRAPQGAASEPSYGFGAAAIGPQPRHENPFRRRDAEAPYSWVIPNTLADGSHKIKARWVTGPDTTAEVVARFWLGAPWQPPKTVYEEPAPALKSLWVTSDNRRAPVEGLYDWSKAGFGGGTVLPTDANVRPETKCRISADELRRVREERFLQIGAD